jgi:hypothetical protein
VLDIEVMLPPLELEDVKGVEGVEELDNEPLFDIEPLEADVLDTNVLDTDVLDTDVLLP